MGHTGNGVINKRRRRRKRSRKKYIIRHLMLLLAIFGSTAQRMDQNLMKQGMGAPCHFVPWNSEFSGLKNKYNSTASISEQRCVDFCC